MTSLEEKLAEVVKKYTNIRIDSEEDDKFNVESRTSSFRFSKSKLSRLGNNHLNFSLQYTPSGCGTLIMYGYVGIEGIDIDELKAIFKIVCSYYNKYGYIGSIFTTIGEGYPNTRKALECLGFKEISTYINPAHGIEKQSMMQLIIQ